MSITKFIRPVLLAGALPLMMLSCGGYNGPFYATDYDYDWDWWDNDYRWWPRPWGGYTIVRRPVYEVDGWTTRAFRQRPYRGFAVRRHNSPVITYNATNGDRVLDVNLKPMGDSTMVEVRARRGKDRYDQNAAKVLMGSILREKK